MQQRIRGFTLIEIMVVVTIIGVLVALIVPNVIGRQGQARVVATKTDISTMKQALKLYYLDNQRYPTTEQGLKALTVKPDSGPIPPNWKSGGYIEKLPLDQWQRPYQYVSPGIKSPDFDIFTYGEDGQPGGEGLAADIGSWDL
jgi:general secretion pathway protein G